VASPETDLGTNGSSLAGNRAAGPPGDRYAISFRRYFHVLTIALLAVNLAIGLVARQQQHAIIDHAIDVYDTAFISTNYVDLAQIAFQHYVDERLRAEGVAETAKANELLDDVLDNMDVAIERATSPLTRAEGQDIKVKLSELRDLSASESDLEHRVAVLRTKMERLRQRNSDIGLKSRDEIEDLSLKADLLLLGSILTSITLAGLVLLVMHRMISSMKRRSNDHLHAALEGMPQGLSMVDDNLRLIVCNATYAEMYDLPADLTQPGTPLRAILDYRARHGAASIDSNDFVGERLTLAAQPTTTALEE
jgi:PAS domain-containing protein